ncbi:hypothetical protein PITCH_A390058 [uncultured Desulfobacterium sp.]|uniref:Uncharacterized protein n=1 Tax=uncultured Desulfobacterium sp. TaxID=201089 RepID=A0A445N033_9BACT|nr:hypothetical protein PITCH_A390058 [uncultured Desulfobacterium sp.]
MHFLKSPGSRFTAGAFVYKEAIFKRIAAVDLDLALRLIDMSERGGALSLSERKLSGLGKI